MKNRTRHHCRRHNLVMKDTRAFSGWSKCSIQCSSSVNCDFQSHSIHSIPIPYPPHIDYKTNFTFRFVWPWMPPSQQSRLLCFPCVSVCVNVFGHVILSYWVTRSCMNLNGLGIQCCRLSNLKAPITPCMPLEVLVVLYEILLGFVKLFSITN